MSGRGKGKGKGKGKGSWRSRGGKGKGKDAAQEADGPIEQKKPTFTKLANVRPNGRGYDLIVEVGDVTPDTTREETRRLGRAITFQCTEAVIGDETGTIRLIVRQPERAGALSQGARVVLLNIKMRRAQDSFWLDADNWSAIKPLEACQDLLPENFDTAFHMNKDVDRSKRVSPKPAFCEIDALEPEKRGISMVCKVLEVDVTERKRGDGGTVKVANALVGDKQGCVSLLATGRNADALQKGAVVVLFNARTEVFDEKFMRLAADRWADIKTLDSVSKDLLPENHVTVDTVVDESKNKSKQEWMLVDEA